MRPLTVLRAAVLASLVVLPSAAQAAGLAIEAAGGAWFDHTPQFDITARVGQMLGQHVGIGLRAGAFINTASSSQLGAQLDVGFRFHINRLWLEPAGGAWFIFGDPAFIRAHVGLGIGLVVGKGFSISMEAGWLQPSPLLLGRVSFAI